MTHYVVYPEDLPLANDKGMQSDYHSFLRSVFGSQYRVYAPYLHTIHLYCLFVITLVITLCTYTAHRYRLDSVKTFEERVRSLRAKYATT